MLPWWTHEIVIVGILIGAFLIIFCMSKSPVSYWICTVGLSTEDAVNWFSSRYGGYTRLLGGAVQSAQFKKTRGNLLIHIVYGCVKGSGWVGLAIWPTRKVKYDIGGVLPVELLNEQERRQITRNTKPKERGDTP